MSCTIIKIRSLAVYLLLLYAQRPLDHARTPSILHFLHLHLLVHQVFLHHPVQEYLRLPFHPQLLVLVFYGVAGLAFRFRSLYKGEQLGGTDPLAFVGRDERPPHWERRHGLRESIIHDFFGAFDLKGR